MSLKTKILCLFFAYGLIAACSNPNDAGTASTPASSESSDPSVSSTAESADVDAAEEEVATAVEEVAETEGAAEESAAADDEISFEEPAAALAPAPINWKFKEGQHYRRMTTSQGTSSPPDKIEVAEVFWYGCSHCYNFDPLVEEWKSNLPADVSFVRIPVIWNPTNQVHARAMYTAEALGVLDKAHDEIFSAIHRRNDQLSDEARLAALFSKLGVDTADFSEAYNSFGVTSAVKRAETLTRRYGVRSVPVLIVNGKYGIDGPEIRTFGDMLNAAEELVERERRGE